MRTATKLFPAINKGFELFEDFFASGKEESISPFLTPRSRKWGKNLQMKASVVSAGCLFFAFFLSFFPRTSEISNLFLLLTYFLAGIPALISAIEDICNFEIKIDVLMTLAAFLSFIIGSGKEGGLLLVLFSFSGSLEQAVSTKAKSAIGSLKKISPQKAHVELPDKSLMEKSVKDILVQTKIHVKAGELVPLDGYIVEGASSLNLVHLTGENLPVPVKKGDFAPAGARNLDGAVTLEVSRISSESTLSKIIQLITEAQHSKPKLERWFDKFSSRYATSIIVLSCILALGLPLFLNIPYLGIGGSVYRALAFLIAASPCALILAVPIAYLSAISAGARQGILLKGGVIFDALSRCKVIAFDKTGTLTRGQLCCLGMETEGDRHRALEIAYGLERSAHHPIAKALIEFAQKEGIAPAKIQQFRSVPGFGLEAEYEGEKVFIGNDSWILPKLPEHKREVYHKEIETLRKKGEIFTLLLYQDSVSLFRFEDSLRPHVKETVVDLEKNLGMQLLMLTGDHESSAQKIAEEAGIHHVFAQLSPEAKLKMISSKENLVMIGDGINDAPSLAKATVGISMGKVGSTTAIDASDIVLLQDNIEKLSWLIRKSRQVVKVVKQNLAISAGAILFAAAAALFGYIPLWLSVIMHEGGTVLVGLNALRLLKKN